MSDPSPLSNTAKYGSLDPTDCTKNMTPQPDGWQEFSGIPADKAGGGMINAGSWKAVYIYCPPGQEWSNRGNAERPVPGGISGTDKNFTFPAANKYSTVIYQLDKDGETMNYRQLTSTSKDEPDYIALDPNTKNIYVAFNDLDGAYGDNSGTIKVSTKTVAP